MVSAQNRERLYWANFPIEQPNDKGIKLIDILEDTEMIGPSAIRGRRLNKATILGRRLNDKGKREDYNKEIPITQCLEVRATNRDKSNCLTTVAKDNVLTTMPIGRAKPLLVAVRVVATIGLATKTVFTKHLVHQITQIKKGKVKIIMQPNQKQLNCF